MSNAWEVSDDDIKQVCFKHGIEETSEAIDVIDRDDVENAALQEVNFDKQVAAALANIEDQLIEAGICAAPKKFTADDPSGPSFQIIVGNIGTVYDGKDKAEAKKLFAEYVRKSKLGKGRAGNEDVVLFADGEPEEEYIPSSGPE